MFTPVRSLSFSRQERITLDRFSHRSAGTTLLLGFDPRTAFAVARSLGRRGVRVVIAALADWETPIPSRAVARYFRLPYFSAQPAEFLGQLLRVIDSEGVDTLIPLTDRALVALSSHQGVLRRYVKLLAPSPEQTSLVLNKTETARLAADLHIPLPTSLVVENARELSQVEHRLNFPVFLKPEDKAAGFAQQSAPRPDVFSCRDLVELRTRLDGLAKSGQSTFLLQERVPGDDVGLAVVMHRGRAVSLFQYRAERMWPADGGVCVAARSETVHTAMAECAIRLLRALSWEGVAELDFRHDRETGRFALLEVNGRFWGSTAAAVATGVDMPWITWQLAHGETPQTEPYRTGQRVRWLEGDLRRFSELAGRASDGAGWRKLARELLPLVWDFRPTVRGMYGSWRDPGPAFQAMKIFLQCWCVTRLREAWSKVFRPRALTVNHRRTVASVFHHDAA